MTTRLTRHSINCGEGQQLDFRYDGCQSVLPPSKHPETGQYQWLNSFKDGVVAPAPEWLELQLVEYALRKYPKAQKQLPSSAQAPSRQTPSELTEDISTNDSYASPTNAQTWGDRPAPGRILKTPGLLRRWNNFRIAGEGETNEAFLKFTQLLKEAGLTCEEAIAAHHTFGSQIPGYHQYASRKSKRDFEHSTWSKRQVINWYRRDGFSGQVGKRGTNLNQRRQYAAIFRIKEAVQAGLSEGITTVRRWIDWIRNYTFKRWGLRTHVKTLYKYLNLWHPEHRQPPTPSPLVELRQGVVTPLADKGSEPLSHLAATANSEPEALAPQKTLPGRALTLCPSEESRYCRGDRVLIDDYTQNPYCGKELTILAITEEAGYTVYALNFTFQGDWLPPSTRVRKNLVTTLEAFVKPAPPVQQVPKPSTTNKSLLPDHI